MNKSTDEMNRFKYKHYRHPFKYFSVLLFLFFLLCIVNYTSWVIYLNPDEYQRVEGFVIEQGSDEFFGVLPRTKWGYKVDGKVYEHNALMINKYLFWDDYSEHISIYVNKKVPEDSLIYFNTYHSVFNYIVFALIGLCLFQIFSGVIINKKIRKYRKEKREQTRAEREAYKEKLRRFKSNKKALQDKQSRAVTIEQKATPTIEDKYTDTEQTTRS